MLLYVSTIVQNCVLSKRLQNCKHYYNKKNRNLIQFSRQSAEFAKEKGGSESKRFLFS